MDVPSEKRVARERCAPCIAVLLSIAVPGLGQFYVGRFARGVVLFVLVLAMVPAAATIIISVPTGAAALAMVILAALRVWVIIDAYGIAKLEPPPPRTWKRRTVVLGVAVVGVLVADRLAIFTRAAIAEPYYVPSATMSPTLLPGDYMMVDKRVYRTGTPRVGDIVVFRYPKDPTQTFMKRIVAGPGDTLTTGEHPSVLSINESETRFAPGHWSYPLTLGDHEYFLVGDAPFNSVDSRDFGPVVADAILGKARFIHFSRLPGTWTVRWDAIGRRLD